MAEHDAIGKMPDSNTNCFGRAVTALTRSEYIAEGLTQVNYKIKDLYEKRFFSKRDKLNKIVIHSSDATVSNNSPNKQDAYTISYSYSVIETNSMTASLTTTISGKVEVEIPFLNKWKLKFDLSYSNSHTAAETQSRSMEYTITAPPQKVSLDPYTKMNVTFDFYRYYDIYDYWLDFVVDDSSTITFPNYMEAMYYGNTLDCCDQNCFLYKNENTKIFNFKRFIHDNSVNIVNKWLYEDNLIKFEQKDDKLIMRNLGRTTEKVMNFGVDIYFNPLQSINPPEYHN